MDLTNFDHNIHEKIRVDGQVIGFCTKPDIDSEKAARIALIKAEAAERISATDWKKVRATERNDGTLQAVLDEREAIRTASDAAEAAVNALTTLEAIKGFSW